MEKICPTCGKTFVTPYPTKIYCNEKCAAKAYYNRDESAYKFLKDSETPIFEFDCAECGKNVKIYSKYDQRNTYCCGQCAKKAARRRNRQRYAKRP